ncbi:MAG: putative PIG3 family NAD(P)H quinone oxidoreductase [Myxococcota bacterium]|jgi:putative PIG3 family NAD(P)H quinone oxidoreductase
MKDGGHGALGSRLTAMFAISDALAWTRHPDLHPAPGQIRIRVAAAGLNRADLLQHAGHYPPPPGASTILGLECAGVVDALGEGVSRWRIGDRVCALLSGGGYAEQVVCPADHALPVPEGLSMVQAAALPEVLATAWLNLYREAALQPGESVVLHAGASGVGTAAIQLCRLRGARCFVTAGSADKIARCVALGADGGHCRHDGDFVDAVKAWAPGGVDVILDPVGAAYLPDNQRILATDGRLVLIGLLGGRMGTVDLGRLLVKRQRLIGSTLRSRSDAEKAEIIAGIAAEVWPAVIAGEVAAVIDTTMPVAEVEAAHRLLSSNSTTGKVILTMS